VTVHTPPLEENDVVVLRVYAGGRELYYTDCLQDYGSTEEYAGLVEFRCETALPYEYERGSTYRMYGVFTRAGEEYASGPLVLDADWRSYEASFLDFSWLMGGSLLVAYLFVMLPVALIGLRIASSLKHREEVDGEYSLSSLLNPLRGAKTLLQAFHALLLSPYFWAFEAIGIGIILLYMALAAEPWKSTTASVAFIFSGLAALIIPFLWCAAWWYADYREREPLRLLVTLFLWGMLAALMAIGINTISDAFLGAFGLGVVGLFLVAPVIEELFKGSGLCLISEHHEYDSVEDGMVFGFVIGMGFSFIENWIYFLGNPLGSDTAGWFVLFLLRSIFFSANHGFYTAITGAFIGWLREARYGAPAFGILAGWPIAAFFHAVHNSGAAIMALLGAGGAVIYCCFLIPVFDYGGFVLLVALFARSLLRKR
jgi:RsiW-degrading membrane proteinase PrsW (M82 family)